MTKQIFILRWIVGDSRGTWNVYPDIKIDFDYTYIYIIKGRSWHIHSYTCEMILFLIKTSNSAPDIHCFKSSYLNLCCVHYRNKILEKCGDRIWQKNTIWKLNHEEKTGHNLHSDCCDVAFCKESHKSCFTKCIQGHVSLLAN